MSVAIAENFAQPAVTAEGVWIYRHQNLGELPEEMIKVAERYDEDNQEGTWAMELVLNQIGLGIYEDMVGQHDDFSGMSVAELGVGPGFTTWLLGQLRGIESARLVLNDVNSGYATQFLNVIKDNETNINPKKTSIVFGNIADPEVLEQIDNVNEGEGADKVTIWGGALNYAAANLKLAGSESPTVDLLTNIAKVMKPGAELIGSIVSKNSLAYRIPPEELEYEPGYFARHNPAEEVEAIGKTILPAEGTERAEDVELDAIYYTHEEFVAMALAAGFEVKQVRGYGSVSLLFPKKPTKKNLLQYAKVLRDLGKGELADEIKRNVERFDFETALRSVENMVRQIEKAGRGKLEDYTYLAYKLVKV